VNVKLSLHAPSEVRHWLEARYVESMDRALLDDVTVLTSEVVSNAVRHSGRPDGDPVTVNAAINEGIFRVEVVDQGAGLHNLEARSIDPPSGLGYLQLLSDRWSSRIANSFHVWFEIDVVSRNLFCRRLV
jgi:anti-sigma regulatory factor (Ser/Thr protein kinase)